MNLSSEVSSVHVLDVGHGNSAIIQSGGSCAIVDSPLGATVLDALEKLGISKIDALFVSHSDRDHIAGILSILTNPKILVESVFVNPDGPKRTKIWGDLLAALRVADRDGDTKVFNSLSVSFPGEMKIGLVRLNILSPVASLAVAGVGGQDENGKRITSNSLSAMIRVEGPQGASLLLAGDIDAVGLEPTLNSTGNLCSDILVYPHHGGSSGEAQNEGHFISRLINSTDPEMVVFSNGHRVHDNPKPHVVEAIVSKGCSVSCTQLSARCCESPENMPIDHLYGSLSKGAERGVSCAGTLVFDIGSGTVAAQTNSDKHRRFVETSVPSPMCFQSIKSSKAG